MKRLSEKSYWAKLYNPEGFNRYTGWRSLLSYSLQNFEYFRIIKKHLSKKDKTIIEVGCAPGSYLIKAHNKLGLTPYGVDYTENGQKLTQNNLSFNGIKKFEIFCSDVFDKKFQKTHEGKYDVVFSNGFVEHFDDFKKTIESHVNLVRTGGKVVISIPNLLYFNKYLTIQEVNDICNLDTMELDFIRNNLPSNLDIKYLGYYGGLLNLGVFFFRNPFLEFLRKVFFAGQRLILEPIFIFLSYIGIRFNWKYSSPAIVLVAVKKKNEKKA